MPIPSRETLIKRIEGAKNYVIEACDYLPCHKRLETCNMCYCIFYPCEDAGLGEYITSSKGSNVWSCMDCSWVHDKKTVDGLREFLKDGEKRKLGPKALYEAFRQWEKE